MISKLAERLIELEKLSEAGLVPLQVRWRRRLQRFQKCERLLKKADRELKMFRDLAAAQKEAVLAKGQLRTGLNTSDFHECLGQELERRGSKLSNFVSQVFVSVSDDEFRELHGGQSPDECGLRGL
jgi:hypothetical protein